MHRDGERLGPEHVNGPTVTDDDPWTYLETHGGFPKIRVQYEPEPRAEMWSSWPDNTSMNWRDVTPERGEPLIWEQRMGGVASSDLRRYRHDFQTRKTSRMQIPPDAAPTP